MFLVVLAAAVLLGVVAAASARFGLWLTTHVVEQRHRALETVAAKRRPPCSWLPRRLRDTAATGTEADTAAAERLRRLCLRRLRGLRRYVAKSQLLADEETRARLLAELDAVRTEWEAADWTRLRCVPAAASVSGEDEA